MENFTMMHNHNHDHHVQQPFESSPCRRISADHSQLHNNQQISLSDFCSQCCHSPSSSCSSSNSNSDSIINLHEIFQDPSTFSLDTLLSDKCDNLSLLSTDHHAPNDIIQETHETILYDKNNNNNNQLQPPKIPQIYQGMANSSESNFIYNYLISDQLTESVHLDPILDSIPPSVCQNDSMFVEIGFPARELSQPEKIFLNELVQACSLLKNPYRRIVNWSNLHSCDFVHWSRIPQYFLHRLIRMSKRLSGFTRLNQRDQSAMLKNRLLEMIGIRSVLMFNPDRETWGFVDDKGKVNVLIKIDVLKPFCTEETYQRHKNLPKLFWEEWKTDNTIFDLLTAIILFTPRQEYTDLIKIQEEYFRYLNLLRRYLEMKYTTLTEAMACFNQLLSNVEEMRQINGDIFRLFRSYGHMLTGCPFFIELLDLNVPNISTQPTNQIQQSNQQQQQNHPTNMFNQFQLQN